MAQNYVVKHVLNRKMHNIQLAYRNIQHHLNLFSTLLVFGLICKKERSSRSPPFQTIMYFS